MINRKARGLAVVLNKEIGNGEFDILPYMNWNAFDSICGKQNRTMPFLGHFNISMEHSKTKDFSSNFVCVVK